MPEKHLTPTTILFLNLYTFSTTITKLNSNIISLNIPWQTLLPTIQTTLTTLLLKIDPAPLPIQLIEPSSIFH